MLLEYLRSRPTGRFLKITASTACAVLCCLSPARADPVAVACEGGAPQACLISDKRDLGAIVALSVPIGSVDERGDEHGIAHYLEHLVFRNRVVENGQPTSGQGPIDAFGNASTTYGSTTYYWQVPPERVVDAIERALTVFNPLDVGDAAAKGERDVVMREREQRFADADTRRAERLDGRLYAGSPLERPVIGTMDEIEAMTLAAANAFHTRTYDARRSTLIVAGQFDAVKVKAALRTQAIFPALPKVQVIAYDRPSPLTEADRVRIVDTFTTVERTYDGVVVETPDNGSTAAGTILGRYLDSDLPGAPRDILVRKRDDVRAVGFSVSEPVPGWFMLRVSMTVRPGATEQALDAPWNAWNEERTRLQENGIPPEAVDRLRARLIETIARTRDRGLETGNDLIGWLASGGTVEDWRTTPKPWRRSRTSMSIAFSNASEHRYAPSWPMPYRPLAELY